MTPDDASGPIEPLGRHATGDDYDVAIVGYGPTGMVLAALLGQAGRRVVVLERYDGLYNLPRAACFDDEIMRVFQKLGLVDEVSGGIVVQRDYEWINAAGETLVKLAYADPAPGGWAALYMMYQPHIETVLDRHDKALPTVDVRQGLAVTGLDQDADGVTLRAVGQGGVKQTVRARFAVGADGGNGFMRPIVCSGVDDYGFQENWLVCDFQIRRTVPGLPMFRQVCDPAQPTSIVRIGPEHHRFSFMLNPGETTESATRPDAVWARVARYLSPDDADLVRVANYVFRSRVADRWRLGRVLLAGDAAHEMPPFLAQGMCSGIRDSHNLSWKLDLILSGQAEESLLDTYQPEREPHVRFITEKAIELGRVQTLRDPEAARQRDERLIARHRANQAPEKLRFPALKGGLVVEDGGFFPQGRVRAGGEWRRFDDVVGRGWCLVASRPDLLSDMTAGARRAWAELGGRSVAVGTEGEGVLAADQTYADWFAEHACMAAIVRPDWYVYAVASDAGSLSDLVEGLAASIGEPVRSVATQRDRQATHSGANRAMMDQAGER